MLFRTREKNSSPRPTGVRPLPILAVTCVVALAAMLGLQHQQLDQLTSIHLPHLTQQLDHSARRIDAVIDQQHRAESVLDERSTGVCLIQGEYIFLDPKTSLPLRITVDQNEADDMLSLPLPLPQLRPIEGESPHSSANSDSDCRDDSDVLLVPYTGTGFLVDAAGYIITNRHVTMPWEVSSRYGQLVDAGYVPQLSIFRCFFPGQPEAFELTVVANSDEDDISLLHAEMGNVTIEPLPCAVECAQVRVGQTVLVLGYPTGFDVMLARLDQEELDTLITTEGLTFERLAGEMARRELIVPVATRGMCGRVSSDRVVYDALTAIGGSGAPVLDDQGQVIAINTALLKGFAGTNFGIPIDRARVLLAETQLPQYHLARGNTPCPQ